MEYGTLALTKKQVEHLEDVLEAQLTTLNELLIRTEAETAGSNLVEMNIEQTNELLLKIAMMKFEIED